MSMHAVTRLLHSILHSVVVPVCRASGTGRLLRKRSTPVCRLGRLYALLLTLFLLAFAIVLFATTGGPDTWGYTYKDQAEAEVSYSWIGANDHIIDDNDWSGNPDDGYYGPVDIGFDFTFYGNTYSQVYISTSGLLSFDNDVDYYSNDPIPSTSSPNESIIAVFWDRLDMTSEEVCYELFGTAPNRYFVVTYDAGNANCAGSITFEVILYETSNEIKFQYQDVVFGDAGYDYGASATVGIENSDGTVGLQYSYNTASLQNSGAIMFYPPPATETTWTGNGDGWDWEDDNNWTNGVPLLGINAYIEASWTGPITMTSAAYCKNLLFQNGSQVTLRSDSASYGLTINGTLGITQTNSLLVIAQNTTATCGGNILVGGTGSSQTGSLELKPNTTLFLKCPSAGDYGLIVDAYGTLTATGTSTASKNCKIRSFYTAKEGYIHLKANSEATFQYCELSYLGNSATPPNTGVYAATINGNDTNEGLTVEDCYLRDNYIGLYLNASSNNTINGTTFYANTQQGIYLASSSNNNTLSGNSCYNNSTGAGNHAGIRLDGTTGCTLTNNFCYNSSGTNQIYGIYLNDGSNNTLNNNTCSTNTSTGIVLYTSHTNTLNGNICYSNASTGIHVLSSYNNMLANSDCFDNGSDGINIDWSTANTLTNNSCYNQNSGIWLWWEANNNTLTNNTCMTNTLYGIYLSMGANNNTLDDNDCYDNASYGIYLESSTGCTLTNNSCFNTGSAQNEGIHLASNANNNTLTGNDCYDNSLYGIYLVGSTTNTLSTNTCSNNSDVGIYLYSSSSNTLSTNTCSNNDYDGIFLESNSNNNTLSQNTCSNNDYDGIYLYSSSSNTLSTNTCSGPNQNYGIYLYNSSTNTLSTNPCSGNTRYGIYLYSNCNNNTLTLNTCSTNTQHGLYLNSSSNNTIEDNICYDNGSGGTYAGIYLDSSTGCTLTNNACYNSSGTNQYYGIYLSGTPTNTLNGNTCSTNTLHGLYITSSYNITLTNENYYGNSVAGLYGTGVKSPIIGCVFGSISGTSQASANAGGDICDVGTLVLQNCLLSSSIEVSDTGTANVLSQRHDQTAGLIRVFGTWSTASPPKFNYADESYTGAGDSSIRKRVEIADSFEVTGGTLEMIGSPTSGTLITHCGTAYGFTVSGGTLQAAHYRFTGLDDNGLYITGTSTTIGATAYGMGLNYGVFKNNSATGPHLKIGIQASRTISNCTFDKDTLYNVWVDIGSTNIITMTNCWLPNFYNPEDYDAELGTPEGTSGEVRWDKETTSVMWTTQGHFEGTEEAQNSNYLGTTLRTDVDTTTIADSVLLGPGYAWSSKSPANNPPERNYHALAYDSTRDRVVLFGGYDSTAMNDTWEWNGTDWTQVWSSNNMTPTARSAHAMAYDAARGKVVLFGGTDGTSNNETWEWDGENWIQVYDTSTPTARYRHAMAYDATQDKIVLFGGTGPTDDTWERNGTNWQQVWSANEMTPTARAKHALAYDSVRGKTVLFGGFPGPTNDTWEWDATDWVQVYGTSTPTARYYHALAYITPTATTAGKTVLFGGWDTTYDAETWEWDGTDPPAGEAGWFQTGSGTPTQRYGHAMAYDSAREEIVLFGGYYNGSLNSTYVYKRGTGAPYESLATISAFKVNAINAANWGIISWNANTPTNTTIKFRTRGADSEADLETAGWSNYYITVGAAITNTDSKWLEVEVTMETTDSSVSPRLDDLQVTYEIPTLVNLVEFRAIGLFGEVLVKWKTATEFENAGFNLYRNTVADQDGWTKINQSLIPGLGNSLEGKAYHFTDYNVEDGVTYYYWLEDIDFNGNTYLHGPVAAHPGLDSDGDGMTDDWEIYHGLDPYRNDADEDPDDDGLTNLEEFLLGTDPFNSDNPNAEVSSGSDGSIFDLINPWTIWAGEFAGPPAGEAGSSGEIEEGLRIISSDETGIVLEMVTARFSAVPCDVDGTQYQALELPGYIHGYTDQAGKAQMPIKPVLLGIPYNIDCTVANLEISSDIISPTGYHIYPVPGFGEDDQSKTINPLNPPDEPDNPVVIPDENFYASDINYPGQAVELVAITSLRGQGIACLNLCPLSYNPAQEQLQLHYRIRFKLVFGATREVSPPADDPPVVLPPSVPELKIAITETGVYRLGYNEIWDAGFQDINWLDPHELKLYYHNQEIPIRVIGEADNKFNLTDYINFYAVFSPTKYSSSSIYWLTYNDGQGLRLAEYTSVSGAAVITPTSFIATVHLEENDIYWRKRTGDESTDRWLWNNPPGGITGTSQANYEIYLPDLTQLVIPVSVSLKAAYYGFYAITPHPNHHTKVYINGNLVDDAYWDGKIEYTSDISITQPALLTSGNNTITLEVLLDTGAERDLVLPNYFEVEYWRDSKALSDTLHFSYTGNNITQFIVSGYTQPAIEVWNITDPLSPTYVTATDITQVSGLYTVAFKDTLIIDVPRNYIILTTDTMKSPAGLVLDEASYLTLTTNKADYLMITHSDFKDSIEPLANLHRSRGLTVEVVDITDIYDEFNYGEASPYALKDFLKYAYESWQRPAPTYVLLAGDASYDYHNYLGYGEHNYVPTYLVPETAFYGETGSDNWLVCLDGDTDFLPDMFIGRIPVRTNTELDRVVDKLIAYAQNPLAEWNKNIILATDNENGFKDHSDLLVSYLSPVIKGIIPRYKDYRSKRFISKGEKANYLLSTIKKLYLGNSNCQDETAFKTQMINNVNNGVLWLNYMGHGWDQGWLQSPNTFNPVTLGWANPDRYPFVASLTCLDGYYLEPKPGKECIAEDLLNMISSGSIGGWSATGMGLPSGHAILNEELVRIIFAEGDRRFGVATTRAKLNLFARAGTQYQDLIETYHLFGDPALSLKCKTSRRVMTYLAKALGQWDGGRAFNRITNDAQNRPKGFEAICAETLLNYETAKGWRDQNKIPSAQVPDDQNEDE